MAMTMTGEVQLPATRETVWARLNDPEVLKICIPGCESLEKSGLGTAGFIILAGGQSRAGHPMRHQATRWQAGQRISRGQGRVGIHSDGTRDRPRAGSDNGSTEPSTTKPALISHRRSPDLRVRSQVPCSLRIPATRVRSAIRPPPASKKARWSFQRMTCGPNSAASSATIKAIAMLNNVVCTIAPVQVLARDIPAEPRSPTQDHQLGMATNGRDPPGPARNPSTGVVWRRI